MARRPSALSSETTQSLSGFPLFLPGPTGPSRWDRLGKRHGDVFSWRVKKPRFPLGWYSAAFI